MRKRDMEKNKGIAFKGKAWNYAGIFLLFLAVSFLLNWSLLIGENLMKYDIWDAEYPSQVLMSEAIANHTLPLWNTLMRYGTPAYAVLGTPVWYFITLILAWFGYTPTTVAFSYAIHIAIGGFGMFLLAGQELSENGQKSSGKQWAGFLVGLLYCCSGVFIGNAQHIMIIISAAWIPYVFLFVRSYLEKKQVVFALAAGFCAAQLLMGGYPEMFMDLFLFLVPYTLYFSYSKDQTVIKNLFTAFKKFILVCIFTVLAGAVILLPFLSNMSLITRGNGLGVQPSGFSSMAYLSFILPKTYSYINIGEPSMTNYYMGIITVLLMPMIFDRKQKNKKVYLSLAVAAFLLCFGENSFLHALLYRFVPMYSSFRFPTLNRIFVAMFVLLCLAPVLQDILQTGKIAKKVLLFTFGLMIIIIGVGSAAAVTEYLHNVDGMQDAANIKTFAETMMRLGVILLVYLGVFYMVYTRQVVMIWRKILVTGIVVIEVFTCFLGELPITIARYPQGQYSWDVATQKNIDREFNLYEKRKRGVNFAGHTRSTSGLNSQQVVFNQTFDEEGYCSFLLKATNDFKQTYFRNIIEQNPEVYFSNHVITPDNISYDEWVSRGGNTSEQIYTDQGLEEQIREYQTLNPKITAQDALNLTQTDNGFAVDGNMQAGENQTGRVRLYWDTKETDTISMAVDFMDSEGNHQTVSGDYTLTEQDGRFYTDIYFPSLDKVYQQASVTMDGQVPANAELIQTERMTTDNIVDVSWFGFNSIQMTVDAPTEGYVTVLQAKHKGWTAYVDGEKTEIATINNCFMGLHVSKGTHTIVMKFRPKEWFIGGAISALYVIVLFVMLIRYGRKKCK